MDGVHTHFTTVDWSVLIGYLILTTWIGHALRGKQSTMKDFFLAGRSLPWQAVCGSIIATEISAITFVAVPGMVFAQGGDFRYLQWAIGSIAARVIVGVFFVKVFYEREIFSPYDYMQDRLGSGARALTTSLFFVSSVLGQSVRLLVTALILRTVTGLNFELCIVLIGLVAIGWTLMGGMTTVIWTDVIQFFVFVFGGLVALGWLIATVDGGVAAIWQTGVETGKLRILDFSLDPDVQFTMWVALIAMPFQNLAAFGTDQLNAQRMFCCRNQADARKAIIASSASQVITLMMLVIGVGLTAYYQQHVPIPAEAKLFGTDPDYVFPVWITTTLPQGLTGLILAGAFAAAISSLDSALAALSQTSLSLVHSRDGLLSGDNRKLYFQSRAAVVIWGVVLVGTAIGLQAIRDQINLLSLAFGMVSYTYGPMLGAFLLAISPIRRNIRGVWIGAILSVLLVLYIRPDIYNLLAGMGFITMEEARELRPRISFAWLFPITCLLTLGCGILFGKKIRSAPESAESRNA